MYSRCCLLSQTERCFGKKSCSSFFAFSGTCFRALVVLLMEKFKTKCKALFSVRGERISFYVLPEIISCKEWHAFLIIDIFQNYCGCVALDWVV